MSNTIRPKIIEAIKQIASSDSSGNSKARIDTQKEFKALQDYLSGNYEELNATERNSVQRLLDNAKEYLKNTIGNVEQNIENEGKINQKNNEDLTNKKPYETDTSVEQNIGNEGKVNPNGDDDSTIKDNQETNAYQQNKIPGKKVIHNGKMCIKTPNGNLYDMQGRRIK